jgi:threonine dehydrogenase-like Zn-dependent dehydrogenase
LPDPSGHGVEGRRYVRLEPAGGALRTVVARVSRWAGSGGRAVIAPSAVGVCRSDLRELAGARPLRRDFGHEIVARVVAADPDELHDLLAAPAVCLDPHVEVTRTSGFAELIEIAAPVGAVRCALRPLPATLASAVGVFVEPFACASHCVARAVAQPPAVAAGRAAVVGAGMAGTLIALGLEVAGLEVDLFNRTERRLEVLRDRGVFAATALRRFDEPADGYGTLVLASAEISDDALDWAFRAVADGGRVVLYGGTTPGVAVAGVDVDGVRRGERRAEVVRGRRTVQLVGTHGALAADFERAIALLERDGPGAPRARLMRLLGPELTLAQAAEELPRRMSGGFAGKAYIRPADESGVS